MLSIPFLEQVADREGKPTNKRQPDKLESQDSQERKGDPETRLGVHGDPEEAAVGGADDLGARLATLKDPVRVARRGIHLIPPAQADQPAPGNVLEVVEVGGEQEDGDDEDQDTAWRRTR